MMLKLAIVGAGRVGESSAQKRAEEALCRGLISTDRGEDAPQGATLEIFRAAHFAEFDTRVTGGSDPAVVQGAAMVRADIERLN